MSRKFKQIFTYMCKAVKTMELCGSSFIEDIAHGARWINEVRISGHCINQWSKRHDKD